MQLIPPAYLKPFLKRNKNDAIDAKAICEAAQRLGTRNVTVKTAGLSDQTPIMLASIGEHLFNVMGLCRRGRQADRPRMP